MLENENELLHEETTSDLNQSNTEQTNSVSADNIADEINEIFESLSASEESNSAEEEVKEDTDTPICSSEPVYQETINNTEGTAQNKNNRKKKKKKKTAGHFWLVLLCCLLSLAFGFGGAYTYQRFFYKPTVIYQTAPESTTIIQEGVSLADIVSKCKDSVVEISCETHVANGFFGTRTATSAGSGVIISEDGFIITNNHVVEDAGTVEVALTSGNTYPAVVYGTDPENDLAVLKINATEDLTPATYASSSDLRVGDTIIAIGNPLGSLGGTVTEGIVSALDREITVEDQPMTLLQISAAVNPGNSGGGLFNINGELVGIVNAKSIGEDVEGLGFAIPSDLVKEVTSRLIEEGGQSAHGNGPVLGIEVVTLQTQEQLQQYGVNRPGVYIVNITAGYGAEAAGLKSGDCIVSINDSAVYETADLLSYLAECKAGDMVNLMVIRDDRILTFQVLLMDSGK